VLYFNLISLFLIVAGAGVLSSQAADIAVSARVYPLSLAALVTVCALAITVKEIAGRAATQPLDGKLKRIFFAPPPVRMRVFAFVAVWLLYSWGLPFVGFIVATTCALTASLWLLGTRRLLFGFLGSLAFAVIFSILFATVLFIPTPSGFLDQMLIETIYTLQH